MTTLERLASGFGLVEGPTYEPGGTLVFSDVLGGGVHRLHPDGRVEVVIPHRRGIGGIARHAEGGLVVSGRNVAWKRDGTTTVLLEPDHDGQSFNDLTTDPAGRIYVGSLDSDPFDLRGAGRPGALHLLDVDGSARVVATDVSLTNGLGVSPDGRRLYHSDTRARTVWVYDRDEGDGSLGPRRAHVRWDDDLPDGLAVAVDGSVWVALADSGTVAVVDADGRERDRVPVEVPMVTSLCFGGAELRDLYVVTGAEGAPDDVRGGVYRAPVPVAGLPRLPATVRRPASAAPARAG